MSGSALFQLQDYQVSAARQIADRFDLLCSDPERPLFTASYAVPFFQALAALTGAGKTAILAEAVAQMAAGLPAQPIVLWISKLRAVVSQTKSELSAGGKLASLVNGFEVVSTAVLKAQHLANGAKPLIVTATSGSFNQDKEASNLKIYKKSGDDADDMPWDGMCSREVQVGGETLRRPLFVVYDEAHNLTDVQTDRLMELRPDAFLASSATLTVRPSLQDVIDRLKKARWADKSPNEDGKAPHKAAWDEPGKPTKTLVTKVPNLVVVSKGLVKREVVLGGYDSIMEAMVDEMLAEMKVAEKAADSLGLDFKPRAIYVCQTNIDSVDGRPEDPSRPFQERRAPPILIWKHLRDRGVDVSTIAAYCNLKVDKAFPLPPNFRLFSGGEKDFESFSKGGFRHVIFNLGLQEGWDDPQVSFAYVDKSMKSDVQVEQVIGRVLRQPGLKHYPDPALNRASFYIRLDDKQGFPAILEEVRKRIGAEPGVEIREAKVSNAWAKSRQEVRKAAEIPTVFIQSEKAVARMVEVLMTMPDHLAGGPDTRGKGKREVTTVRVGKAGPLKIKRSDLLHSNRVTARWLVRREMRALYPRSLHALNDKDARFDAMVDRTSLAAQQFRELGKELAETYVDSSTLRLETSTTHPVGPVDANPAKAKAFKNALHAAYELGKFESEVAQAIDAVGLDWCRNPQNGGWSVPLLNIGATFNFYPDFLVWKGKGKARTIFALDPKGEHILKRDAGRKVMTISKGDGGPTVFTRLLSEGKWTDDVEPAGKGGVTVWGWDGAVGKLKHEHYDTVQKAVEAALTT